MPESLKKLINLISFLPGIGEKTASKLAFFLLNSNESYKQNLSSIISEITNLIGKCSKCNGLVDSGNEFCNICSSNSRNKNIICLVEDYYDLVNLEETKSFNGLYHVLGGAISPINGVFASDLNIKSLINRINSSNEVLEIIFATNINIEGEATLAYIKEQIFINGLSKMVKMTRLSRGLSSGYIEYSDEISLINAIRERKEII